MFNMFVRGKDESTWWWCAKACVSKGYDEDLNIPDAEIFLLVVKIKLNLWFIKIKSIDVKFILKIKNNNLLSKKIY